MGVIGDGSVGLAISVHVQDDPKLQAKEEHTEDKG